MDTRPLTVGLQDLWAIRDCLQPHLAGFHGRQETSEPWHAMSLMTKVRSGILVLSGTKPNDDHELELNEGELTCIDFNVPNGAYEEATDLLMRVYKALEELKFGMPLTSTEPVLPRVDRLMAEFNAQWPSSESAALVEGDPK